MEYLLSIEPKAIEWTDRSQMTPIFYSVKDDHLEMTKYLIEKGANIHHRDRKLSTPFYLSVLYASDDVFQLLLDSGSDICVQNRYQRTPLMKAIYLCSEVKTLALLNCKEIDINMVDSNGRNVLHMACWGNGGGRKGKVVRHQVLSDYGSIVPVLIENGIDVLAKDRDGNSALMVSCSTNAFFCVKYWYDNNYDFNHINIYKENPLLLTTRYGNEGNSN